MPPKILIIDDDRTNVMLVKTRLEAMQYEVATAYDGDAGLEQVQREKPDLIILDVEMPRMNGYSFLSELKKNRDFKNLKVIVVTAHAEMQPIFNLKGVNAYIVKPLQMDVLVEKIRTCLTSNEETSPQQST